MVLDLELPKKEPARGANGLRSGCKKDRDQGERSCLGATFIPSSVCPRRLAWGKSKRIWRLVFSTHPDVGGHPDPERFREVHEAYEILSDPEQRRAYDVKFVSRRQPISAEALRPKAQVTVLDDFLSVRPSIEEVVDHIRQNFFGARPKSGGPYRRLGMEAIRHSFKASVCEKLCRR